jgi:antitoxin component YwqK of YwqJK toxin-antitoxin module
MSLALLTACNHKTQEQGIGYTEYINALELEKNVIQSYENGKDMAVVFFVKDDPEANIVKEIHYYENGNIQVEGTLKNKQRHGVWIFYHDNGNIWSKGEFDNGKSIGCFEIYKPNGELKIKSYYEDNKKVREEYYKDNKLEKTVDL